MSNLDEVKKIMGLGNFNMCDVDEIDEDHIHLESWDAKTEFLNLMKLQN